MARVTKINVGGTNYDIAHEGELKNSGFEVVTELPTTNLFVGRQVMYNGQLYMYNGSQWENVNAPYEANLLWGGRNIAGGFSPIDAAMVDALSANLMAFPNPAGITVEYSRDAGVTWLDYGATDKQKIEVFSLGRYHWTCGKPTLDSSPMNVNFRLRVTLDTNVCGFYSLVNKVIAYVSTSGSTKCWLTILAKQQMYSDRDTFYETIVDKATIDGWPGYNVLNFSPFITWNGAGSSRQYDKIRFVFGYDSMYEGYDGIGLTLIYLSLYGNGRYRLPSNLARNKHLYSYDWQQNAFFPAKVKSEEVINFDINNIEPTQTGNVIKTSTWLWQYLVQGVNWLKANKVALSVYNAKVAELVQADSDNNAYIQSVKEELSGIIDEVSGGLAAVARSGSYNDLTDKPTLFSGSYNDLTDKPTIPSTFADLGGNVAASQISEGSIDNSKLVNSSMSLNGTTVNLGDTAILPWYVSYNGVDYPARLQDNWLQIYRNEVWANLLYLAGQEPIQPTNVVQITSLDDLSWYDERVSEYEIDDIRTFKLLNGDVSIAALLLQQQFTANQLTLNLYPIPSGRYNKGALDKVISDLKDNNFAVFAENDLDTILASGNDFCVRIKVSKVPTYKAIIECYVAR